MHAHKLRVWLVQPSLGCGVINVTSFHDKSMKIYLICAVNM
jgi:hypothetical protein